MAERSLTDPAAWPASLAAVREQMGEPLNVHRFLASYPEWLIGWWGFRNHVIHGRSLSARQYELIVLRVATLCDAPYEWEHHVVTAGECGLVERDLANVRIGPSAAAWAPEDKALLEAVDECLADRRISKRTLAALARHYSDRQVLDLVATVVMYHAMAIVTRTFDIPVDEHKPSFSEERYEE